MLFLKQSTACTVKIGPFIDNTDGYTVLDALTILQANIRLSKNGGNMAQKNEATSATHDELGYYDCPLNTTDTATLGRLQLVSSDAAAMPVPPEYFEVVTANVYDTFFSTDTFDVNVTSQANIDFSALQKTSLNAASVTVSDKTGFSLSSAGIDSFWDETLAGHGVADSAGLALRNLLKIGKNKYSYVGTVFTIYNDNGVDVLYQFNLDSATTPTTRTPA
jgi:hypothetical protein